MRALMLVAAMAPLTVTAQEEGFVSLSGDPTLSAWRQPADGAWECNDGVIKKIKGGTLFSEQMYEDFCLRLEYRIEEGGNSGLFLRAPLSGRHSALGMEMQILGDHGKPPSVGSSGALYAAKAPDVAATNPDGEECTATKRVVRGGSWFSSSDHCRSASRYLYQPEARIFNLGFRVARTL